MVGENIICCESKFVGSDPAASNLLKKSSFKVVSMEEAIEIAKHEPFDVSVAFFCYPLFFLERYRLFWIVVVSLLAKLYQGLVLWN